MELYASGFNAWNQLCFDSTVSDGDTEPKDLSSFTCVLEDTLIERPDARQSFTIVKTNRGPKIAGCLPRDHARLHSQHQEEYTQIAEASNGVVVALGKDGSLSQYPSLTDLLGQGDHRSFSVDTELTQLVAYETGFVALSSIGEVWTWGDERYGACLGREISEESHADQPGLVLKLKDLPTGPITRIAAGGYTLAALTSGNDLYLWGGRPGAKPAVDEISDEPMPIVNEDKDISDVAVGDSHIVALTTDGEVYVIGENGNGQLGIPRESANAWTKVGLELTKKQRITGVAAGPRSSFIMVQKA